LTSPSGRPEVLKNSMFSNRFSWDLPINALSRILAAKRAAGVSVLDLTCSNPTLAGFKYDGERILAALSRPESLSYAPCAQGLGEAREALAEYYQGKGCSADPEGFFLTASTSEAYAYLFKLLADPGDEVFIPQPCYPLLEPLAFLEGVRLAHYPMAYDPLRGWRIDTGLLEDLLTTRTRAVVVISPNNPAGSFLKKRELSGLDAICARHGLALIVDEVFSDYGAAADEERVATAVQEGEALTFVVSGLSKVSGLPQVKLGWIHAGGPEAACGKARAGLEFIADTYLSVSTPVQLGTRRLLDTGTGLREQIRSRITKNHAFLEDAVARTGGGCRLLRREGGWYAVLDFDNGLSDDARVCGLLEHRDVLVHPGYFYDFPREGFVVVSLLAPPEVFHSGVRRLAAAPGDHRAAGENRIS